ncbi:MAG: thioesterase family protein [Gammaproteobacteria bacterium]|nr:thioesterase family protein [Gammaproteobacteria bacterium]
MNLYLRLLLIWLRNIAGTKRHHSHGAESRFRVLPHDLDALGHMNNGRYLQIMDVARVEWMLQTQVAGAIRKNRWSPILGGGVIRYRHSLRLLQLYRVRTRLLGWDERWFYLEHSFKDSRGRCVAVGVTRAGLRSDDDWVHTDDVVNSVQPGARSPAIPEHIHDWVSLEEAMFRHGSGRRKLRPRPAKFRRVS